MFRASCLRVPTVLGEEAIRLVRRLGLFERGLRVQRAGDWLHVPLTGDPSPAHLRELRRALPEFEVSVCTFPERSRRPLTLMEALEDRLPPHLLAALPRSIDFIGEIAVVEFPPELEGYKGVVAEAILAVHGRVRTVLGKAGAVGGTYRVREFEVLAGAWGTETVHREHGCAYHLDLARVYFSPRLSNEHRRVADQVREGETVVDMFAGVGPFSILIAKPLRDVRVYAVDVNPDAVAYLERNIRANRVQGRVTPILGDIRQVIGARLAGVVDRAIMNLPEKAVEYVDVACEALKPEGGIVHYYEFTEAPNPLEAARNRLTEAVKGAGRSVREVLSVRIVREIAPYTWQVGVDAEVQ